MNTAYSSKKIINIVLSAFMVALISIMAQISIPIGPVPITLQILAIFIACIILPPPYAFMSLLSYLLLGIFGLPVFAGATGGFAKILGPTGGYLLSFPIAAYVISLLNKKLPIKNDYARMIVAMLVGLIFIYIIGFLYLALRTKMSLYKAFMAGVVPFIAIDILKAIFAAFIVSLLKTRKVLNNA